mmetsp:Transcript_25172/g.38623  ORF Transcript_25172/g.38623 Transcript_25172/m.38623 type:complete len:113 (+) Transcript_25172:1-339(+)
MRIGGGEIWNDVYKGLYNWNNLMPRKNKYSIIGGGAGTVAAAGGWLQGGGLSFGPERLWGIGVDNVLELEMVLSDGSHVKFAPSKWKTVEEKLYPQTIEVSGKCNQNIDFNE